MDTNSRLFLCDKAAVLNVIYDALEAVSFVIDRSNSYRGTLIVSSLESPQLGGRIAVSPDATGNGSFVEVFPHADGAQQEEWIAAFFDEMRSLIERNGMEARK